MFAGDLKLEPRSPALDLSGEGTTALNVITCASSTSSEYLANDAASATTFAFDSEYQGVYV